MKQWGVNATIEAKPWMINCIPHETADEITYPCSNLRYTMLVSGASGLLSTKRQVLPPDLAKSRWMCLELHDGSIAVEPFSKFLTDTVFWHLISRLRYLILRWDIPWLGWGCNAPVILSSFGRYVVLRCETWLRHSCNVSQRGPNVIKRGRT